MICIRNVILAMLLAVSFSPLLASEESRVRESVRQYIQGVITASKKDRVDHMEPYATEKRAQKLFIWLKSWHENNYFMDSIIENVAIQSTRITGAKATVTTKEQWRYRYIQIVTKEITHPWTRIDYTMQYELVKIGLHWKVDNAKILFSKEMLL